MSVDHWVLSMPFRLRLWCQWTANRAQAEDGSKRQWGREGTYDKANLNLVPFMEGEVISLKDALFHEKLL